MALFLLGSGFVWRLEPEGLEQLTGSQVETMEHDIPSFLPTPPTVTRDLNRVLIDQAAVKFA